MSQKWIRAHPLQWLDSILSSLVTPFSKARTIESYATNGYYLFGIVLALLTLSSWGLGLLGGTLSQLPAWFRNSLSFVLELMGLKSLPETIPLIALIALLYGFFYTVKRVRLFVGEKFADAFFGAVNLCIAAGEFCLEHRWVSLFVVIGLAGVITWGTYYLVDKRLRHNELINNFNHWLDQADKFSDESAVTQDESYTYNKLVKPFWSGEYAGVVALPDGQSHPAFLLHEMLEGLYNEQQRPEDWYDFLRRNLQRMRAIQGRYRPPSGRDVGYEERRAWALVNILLGRVLVRLTDKCVECKELVEAKACFTAIGDQYRNPEYGRYQAAAHNGMGTVYAHVLTSWVHPSTVSEDLRAICSGPAECAEKAFEEYSRVVDSGCSFAVRRRENNRVHTLVQIGLNYKSDQLSLKNVRLDEICNRYIKNGNELADCIEGRLGGVMQCAAQDPFIPIPFVTAAQAYGINAELRRKDDPNADVSRETLNAGNYLRLAYILNKNANRSLPYWKPCLFQLAVRDVKLQTVFRAALTSGLDRSPSVQWDELVNAVEKDAGQCQ